jgi:hypothetical protein
VPHTAQGLGRPDRLLNGVGWYFAVSKRERPALGRFATRCFRSAGGRIVGPTKLGIGVSTPSALADVGNSASGRASSLRCAVEFGT